MNLKNKTISIITGALFISALSFNQAYAEDSTYAVVDSSGVVTNVIVCSAATCGPNGAWGGKMPSDTGCPGCSLVLQIAANPTTGAYQGAIFPSADSGQQMTYNEGRFTITDKNTSISQEVIVEEIESSTVITALTTVVEGKPSKSFTYEDTVGKDWGQIVDSLSIGEIPDNTKATILATEKSGNDVKQESASFNQRKSTQELQTFLEQNELNILSRKMLVLARMLGSWLL